MITCIITRHNSDDTLYTTAVLVTGETKKVFIYRKDKGLFIL